MTAVVEQDLTGRLRECLARQPASLAASFVRSVSLVGSVARGEGRPTGDVDLLLDLAPGAKFDLVDLVTFKEELAVERRPPQHVSRRPIVAPGHSARVLNEGL